MKTSIFTEYELSAVLENQSSKLRGDIESQSESYILNVNETEFIDYLVKEYSINPLVINADGVFISHDEKAVPIQSFGRGFYSGMKTTAKKVVVKYHLPFQGDANLLKCKPSSWIMWSTEVTVENNCICFEVPSLTDNPEEIKRTAQSTIDNILRQAESVTGEVAGFNSRLRNEAQQAFQSRKQRYLKNNDLVASLGVPVKKRNDYPKTFAIPSPQIPHSVKVGKPNVDAAGYKPEPTLDESTYTEILQVIHDVGRQFERMPSTYANKREEDLRDHFLLYLEPRFEGSATGETFNKSGKTDILLRHEGKNAFIAECKYWRGAKAYSEAITQLLSYLTWRDSKAALIVFVRNTDLSTVISQVEATTSTHPNFLGFVNEVDSTWFSYRFHVNGDPNREVKLAVLLFHFPPTTKGREGNNI